MIDNDKISLLKGNSIELHYWFDDDSHLMDAIIQNKCEYEFLGVLKEIATVFNCEIVIETSPFATGGIRRWFKIVAKEESKKAPILTAIIVTLLTSVLVTPITTSVSKTTEILIERIFEDDDVKKIEKENLKLENERLRQEIEINNQKLASNVIIKKKKSNFYETLEVCSKVNKVSFSVKDENRNKVTDEEIVYKHNFKDFVLVSDDLAPIEIDNAIIEIISPVLKKSSYKWMGIYEGNPMPFNMKSSEFKSLIQSGVVKFKNGTSIDCLLSIRKKIDNEGFEKVIGYDVIRVNKYFENNRPIETLEGRHYRQKKEADKLQTKLFVDE